MLVKMCKIKLIWSSSPRCFEIMVIDILKYVTKFWTFADFCIYQNAIWQAIGILFNITSICIHLKNHFSYMLVIFSVVLVTWIQSWRQSGSVRLRVLTSSSEYMIITPSCRHKVFFLDLSLSTSCINIYIPAFLFLWTFMACFC